MGPTSIGPSWDLVADVQLLLYYPFMRNAFVAGTLVAIMAGLLGFFMVARSQSFAAHSLTNTGFAGATGAGMLGAPPVIGLFIASALAAVGIHTLGDRRARESDIAVGAVLTASLALGFLFVRLSASQYAGAVYDTLFGNTLGVSQRDILVIAGALALVALALIAGGRPLYFASLDPDVAEAKGVPTRALDLGFLVLLAVVVAVAVEITGVLLIFALLVTPAAIARRVTPRPARALALGVSLAVAFTWLGLAAGYFTLYPVGFYITTIAFACYVAVQGLVWARRARRTRRTRARLWTGGAA